MTITGSHKQIKAKYDFIMPVRFHEVKTVDHGCVLSGINFVRDTDDHKVGKDMHDMLETDLAPHIVSIVSAGS